jgi:hypothetical protein
MENSGYAILVREGESPEPTNKLLSFTWTREFTEFLNNKKNLSDLYSTVDYRFVTNNLNSFGIFSENMNLYGQNSFDENYSYLNLKEFIKITDSNRLTFEVNIKTYKEWFDINPGINKFKEFKYVNSNNTYVITYSENQLNLVIVPLDGIIQYKLNEIGIKYVSTDNGLIINYLDMLTYYRIASKLQDMPSWKDITGEDVDYISLFVQSNPEYLEGYLKQHIEEYSKDASIDASFIVATPLRGGVDVYPKLLELVINEEDYIDLLIYYGVIYVENVLNGKIKTVDKNIVNLGYILLSHKDKVGIDRLKQFFKILMRLGSYGIIIEPQTQQLINRFFAVITKYGTNQIFPFDIKLDEDTLFKLAGLIK